MARRATETMPDEALPADAPRDPSLDAVLDSPLNPLAVRDAYRLHRARRKARVEHRRRMKRAGMRFWLSLVVLLVASAALAITIWHEVQQLFGL
jgi:hypothetical protein